MRKFITAITSILVSSYTLHGAVADNLVDRVRSLGQTLNPAIVTVVDSNTNVQELCFTFQSLVRAKGFPTAPILTFSSFPLSDEQKGYLRGCTPRPVSFVDNSVFYATFPVGFTPKAGQNYEFQQTQRFLVTHLWNRPELDPYDVIMRVSDSTCLTFDSFILPGLNNDHVYQSQVVPGVYEIGRKYTHGLYDKAFAYLSSNLISPENIYLWSQVVTFKTNKDALPLFNNDFEVVRKDLMRQDAVQAFHLYITDTEHEALYFWKWSVSSIRYLTMAAFTKYEEMTYSHLPGIVEKDFLTGNFFPNLCRVTQ